MKSTMSLCAAVIFVSLYFVVMTNGQCPAPGDCLRICGSSDHIYHCNPPSCNCRCGIRAHPLFCRPAPLDCASFCGGRYPFSAICSGVKYPQCSCFC